MKQKPDDKQVIETQAALIRAFREQLTMRTAELAGVRADVFLAEARIAQLTQLGEVQAKDLELLRNRVRAGQIAKEADKPPASPPNKVKAELTHAQTRGGTNGKATGKH